MHLENGNFSEWTVSKWLLLGLLTLLLAACVPTPEGNVIGYYLARSLGTLNTHDESAANTPTGTLSGTVINPTGEPISGATVLVASRTGTPYATQSDAYGNFAIQNVPAGQYVPAAVAPDYDETVPQGWLAIPSLATIRAGITTTLAPLILHPHQAEALPAPLPAAVALAETATYTASAPFPAGAVAQVHAYQFDFAGATIDTLRVYLPLQFPPDGSTGRQLPMLFMIYPTAVDSWESVSVSFAAAGYALVAISPIGDRALAIDEHAQDARVALALARGGYLHPAIFPDQIVMLGGSFSSPILHRLMRDERAAVAAWITVGGISNAFSGSADFYAGRLEITPDFELLIPALGAPNLYPLPFLRYSPVYTAAQLPPTLIIHTAADKVTPIDQAYQLEAALKAAHVPVEVFYYEDVSHYLQIGDDLSEAGQEMYFLILDFAQRYQSLPPMP
ncbi:MAG: carboxypeptidase regulatory-like domain-containing protein [Caldilineaceae bacterium]|nr:carboxypeptidase regulatory-like domain-containing protein [Caldilineaceae bacterium]